MARAKALAGLENFGELLEQLGGISPRRIRLDPLPGTATEKDLLKILDRTNRIYELVDGVLVEKVMGYPEGALAADIIFLLRQYLERNNLGDLVGADATMRIMTKLVRIPDVSFIRWGKYPGGKRPTEPIPDLVPDLAIEVLSAGNTRGEMARKLREYFLAGVEAVWMVDPRKRTVSVYTPTDQDGRILTEADTLDGGTILPGLNLPVRRIFERVPVPEPARKKRVKTRRKKGG
jgi:Uma2 family endonuclease